MTLDSMSILDLIVVPGVGIGCLVGIAIAVGLHWLFPENDLLTLQALVIVVSTATGICLEFWPPG